MIHTPDGCSTLEKVERQQIRELLQGYYGQGKTFSALTAPNPCVLNLDNNLGAHVGRADVINVPFYDKKFAAKYSAAIHVAVPKWIADVGTKLSEEQTLVIDGLTNLNNAYDREVGVPMSTKTGKLDMQAWWGDKLDWQKELFESLKALKCDVIICCHEQPEREKTGSEAGELTGKILPLVQGSFKDQLGTHFTDVFRQHAVSKLSKDDIEKNKEKLLVNYGMKSVDEYIAFQNSFETNTMYIWQTSPDSLSACKCHLVNQPKYIRANWNIFK